MGECEAREGENTNMKSPRAFWKCSRRNTAPQLRSSFGGKGTSWGSPEVLAGRLWAATLQAVDGSEVGKGCDCSKASWNFSVPFVSKQENKVLRKPWREEEASCSISTPPAIGKHSCGCITVLLRCFFGSLYLVPTRPNESRREVLGRNQILAKTLTFLFALSGSTGCVWLA